MLTLGKNPDNSIQCPTLIDALPGWLCLLAGMTMLALVVLAPASLGDQSSHWQLQLMREQSRRLQRQMTRYEQFDDALTAHDPAVIKRLAFAELRLKPAGRQVLGTGSQLLLSRQLRPLPESYRDVSHVLAARQPGRINDWLNITQPIVGLDFPRRPENHSILSRLSTGPLRWLGLSAALTILLIALLFTPDQP